MDDLAVLPLGDGHLLHMDRLSCRRDEIYRTFVERDVVTHGRRSHIEAFPLFDAVQELLLSLMFAANPFVGGFAFSCMAVSWS